MIKQIAWNTFKNTGNIDTYMELAELKNVNGVTINENNNIDNNKVNNYGEYQNKGINLTGK